MLRSTQLRKLKLSDLAPFTASTLLILSQGHFSVALAAAPPEDSEQQESTAEVSIQAERQTALAKQAMTISETPDAGPQSKHRSVVLGLGAIVGPDYLGSKTDKVGAIPVIDVRGLWGGRLYISDLAGLGLNLVDTGSFRAGLNLGPANGRKSSIDSHLKGLPDISDATSIGGFMAYWRGPLAFQATIAQRVGPHPGRAATLGAAYSVAPVPNLQLNFSTSLTWADASLQNTIFGISPAAAARAAAVGNPLPAYTPGAGAVNIAGTASAVYLLGAHWGVVTRVGLVELVGNSVRDSPLTQRAFQPNVAVGVLYVF
jgi:outer membrane scaffolding protein for murein synthesis (MipA/OmpV family)